MLTLFIVAGVGWGLALITWYYHRLVEADRDRWMRIADEERRERWRWHALCEQARRELADYLAGRELWEEG